MSLVIFRPLIQNVKIRHCTSWPLSHGYFNFSIYNKAFCSQMYYHLIYQVFPRNFLIEAFEYVAIFKGAE